MGARLAATVYVTDPDTHQTVRLDQGSESEARLAALVSTPQRGKTARPPPPRPPSRSPRATTTRTLSRPPVKRRVSRPWAGRPLLRAPAVGG